MSENSKTYISFWIALVSASIYSFSLGYLDYFKIIDYPNWVSSLAFYFSSILSVGSKQISNNLETTNLFFGYFLNALWITAIIFVAISIAAKAKKKSPWILFAEGSLIKISVWISIKKDWIITLFVLLIALSLLNGIVNNSFLVFIAPTLTLYFIIKILQIYENANKDKNATKDEQSKNKLHILVAAVITLFMSWFLTYKLGRYTGYTANPGKSFPSAWSGGPYISNDLLVWKEDEKGFWINCKEKIIYGITNEGHIFFSRSIDDVIKQSKCK